VKVNEHRILFTIDLKVLCFLKKVGIFEVQNVLHDKCKN